jgi:hypothetical protein
LYTEGREDFYEPPDVRGVMGLFGLHFVPLLSHDGYEFSCFSTFVFLLEAKRQDYKFSTGELNVPGPQAVLLPGFSSVKDLVAHKQKAQCSYSSGSSAPLTTAT